MSLVSTGIVVVPSANFTRPGDTTSYTSGDLVANSTTAGSVVPMSWSVAQVPGGAFAVRRARIKKSGTTVSNASFRLHLYKSDPSALSSGIANGDNAAWSTKDVADYIGSIDVAVAMAFVDGAAGIGVPISGAGTEINAKCAAASQTIYGLLEAKGAYAPANAEVFTVELEVLAH
jgi:hypothetical protein